MEQLKYNEQKVNQLENQDYQADVIGLGSTISTPKDESTSQTLRSNKSIRFGFSNVNLAIT